MDYMVYMVNMIWPGFLSSNVRSLVRFNEITDSLKTLNSILHIVCFFNTMPASLALFMAKPILELFI